VRTAHSGLAPRRTQQQRRELTIRKLLDAATDTLIEVGYAEASVQRICDNAGVSQGALFRHFSTREELMVAVGADVGARILEHFERQFSAAAKRESDVEAALRLVRDACRSRLNTAWYELELAARTNANLKKALEPVLRSYFTNITALARELLPDVAARLGPAFDMLVTTVIMLFDGETTHRFLIKDTAVEDARLAYLVRGLELLQRR
jgi:AcrR family transcriptional regulator